MGDDGLDGGRDEGCEDDPEWLVENSGMVEKGVRHSCDKGQEKKT